MALKCIVTSWDKNQRINNAVENSVSFENANEIMGVGI